MSQYTKLYVWEREGYSPHSFSITNVLCYQGCFLLNHAVINKSKTNIHPSGDCFYISNDPPWFLMLADGIGSGNEARFAAKIATSLAEDFCKNYFSDRNLLLPSLITRCHKTLKIPEELPSAVFFWMKRANRFYSVVWETSNLL